MLKHKLKRSELRQSPWTPRPTDINGVRNSYVRIEVLKSAYRLFISDVSGNMVVIKSGQGHPTAVFCKISARRSKNCQEFSLYLEEDKEFVDDRSIHVQFWKLI